MCRSTPKDRKRLGVCHSVANPDVPFCFLVLLACFAALRPGFDERLLPIFGLGLIVGLAVSTKLLGVLLVPALFVFAWQHQKRVRALVGASLLAVLGALPLALWNALHGWPTLRYHLVDRHTAPVGPSWSNVGKWIGGQLAYVSPWLLVLFAVALVTLARRPRRAGAGRLLWISLPLLLGGYGLIWIVPGAEPHWPLAGYLPLVPAAAGVLATAYANRRSVRTLTWVAGVASLALFVLFHGHILTNHGVGLMPRSYVARYDLSNELVGWPEIADRTNRAIHRLRRQQPGRTVVATGCHYTSCSQLRFAARGRFDVRCISPRIDQFDLASRGDGSRLRDVDVLYLWDERFPYPAARLYRCAHVEPIEQISIVRAGRTVRRFELQLCRRFGGLEATDWPPVGGLGQTPANSYRAAVSQTKRPSDRRDSWIRDSS